jgi:hypothetical protein
MPLFVLTITEIRNVGYHPDTHAARVTGQIGNRDVVDVQYDDTCRVGAGVKRALGGLGSGRTRSPGRGRCRMTLTRWRRLSVPIASPETLSASRASIVDNTASRSSSASSPGSGGSTRPPLS